MVSLITRIDFDHENFLGHSSDGDRRGKGRNPQASGARGRCRTAPGGARSGSGARGRTAVPVIETAASVSCRRRIDGRRLAFAPSVTELASGWSIEIAPRLPGRFQLQNALSAVAAARLLATTRLSHSRTNLSRRDRGDGLARAHRESCSRIRTSISMARTIRPQRASWRTSWEQNFREAVRIFLLYGALRDKAVDEIAGLLFPRAAEVIFTEPRTSRAISAAQLAEISAHHATQSSIIRGRRAGARLCCFESRARRRDFHYRFAVSGGATSPVLETARAGRGDAEKHRRMCSPKFRG